MALPISEIVSAQYLGTTAAQLYASPASTATRIDKLSVINNGSSTATVSLYLVPSGNAVGGSNCTTNAKAILPGDTFNSPNEYGHYLNPGDSLWGVASAATQMTILVGGTVVTG